MSGSVKYVVGGAFGPKSRGGIVTVLGGPGGFCGGCAPAARGHPDATAAAPSASTNRRRVSIDCILHEGDRAPGVTIDRWIAARAHGAHEIFDERHVDVRRRRMRF